VRCLLATFRRVQAIAFQRKQDIRSVANSRRYKDLRSASEFLWPVENRWHDDCSNVSQLARSLHGIACDCPHSPPPGATSLRALCHTAPLTPIKERAILEIAPSGALQNKQRETQRKLRYQGGFYRTTTPDANRSTHTRSDRTIAGLVERGAEKEVGQVRNLMSRLYPQHGQSLPSRFCPIFCASPRRSTTSLLPRLPRSPPAGLRTGPRPHGKADSPFLRPGLL
jgi:hypothetical protein